jgi:folate-dependent phosphoribosylglycinamide formyltransferase PurN
VRADDTVDSLLSRIQAVEKPLFVETIRHLCRSL